MLAVTETLEMPQLATDSPIQGIQGAGDMQAPLHNAAESSLNPILEVNTQDAGASVQAENASSSVVSGVEIPAHVLKQLRELGVPLESYTRGELQAAVQACLGDARLIDDPNDTTFLGMLHKDPHEAASERGDSDHPMFGNRMRASNHNESWVERIGGKPATQLDPEAQSFCEKLIAERANDSPEIPHLRQHG